MKDETGVGKDAFCSRSKAFLIYHESLIIIQGQEQHFAIAFMSSKHETSVTAAMMRGKLASLQISQ